MLRDEIISRRCKDEGGVVVSRYTRGVLHIEESLLAKYVPLSAQMFLLDVRISR